MDIEGVRQKYSDQLMQLPNVIGVGTGVKTREGGD